MSNLIIMKNKPQKTIVISGYYGFGNAGDEAILASMVCSFRENIPDAQIIVLSNDPAFTSKEYNVESHHRMNVTGIFRLLGEADILISGGGGLVQDVTGFYTVLYYLAFVQMARLRGKKVMIYANGFGPLTMKKSRIVAKFIMNQASLITFRDEESKKLSDEIGINKPPIYVTADPVFILKPAPAEITDTIADSEGIKNDRFKLGISLRPWKTDNDYISLLAELADLFVLEKQADVFIFPFQESQDLDVCKKLKEKMKNPARIIERVHSIPIMMDLIGRMDMNIGMRLHFLIFSIVQNTPSVGISYDPKVTNLMNMMELPYIDIRNFGFDDLLKISIETYYRREDIRKKLPHLTQPLKEKAAQNVELLKKLLEDENYAKKT